MSEPADGHVAARLTIDEFVSWADPPITRRCLADLITALKVESAGTRKRPVGRPALTYDASELMRLHSAVAEWLLKPARTGTTRPVTSRDG